MFLPAPEICDTVENWLKHKQALGHKEMFKEENRELYNMHILRLLCDNFSNKSKHNYSANLTKPLKSNFLNNI